MRQLSGEHVAALCVAALAAVAAAWAPRRLAPARVVLASRALSLAILGAYVTEYVANTVEGTWEASFNLPFQLTDAVTIVAIVALWSPRPLLVELVYFWALTASLQAVLTPDLGQAFPSVFYFTYFATHIGAVTAAFLLVLGRGLLPRPGAAARVFALTVAFAAVAAVADVLTGGNYMFLRAKPEHGSLLDALGPWPWYIAGAAVIAAAMLAALEALAAALRRSLSSPAAGSPPSAWRQRRLPRA